MRRESIEGVRHSYGQTQVLHGIDLTLEAGTVTALLGPSGSGKTTLLAIAGGLLTPTAGRVMVGGMDLYWPAGRPDPTVRRQTAYALQASSLIGFLTTRDNLLVRDVIAGHRAEGTTRADNLLARVGLEGKASRYPAQLSGGERQRVAVAAALYTGAPVILADEPTSALDRQAGRAVMALLRDHARELGASVLVATHDERALDLADRIIHIEDGLLAA